jgi:glycosyltransferase involved in cell wall biosynthesis
VIRALDHLPADVHLVFLGTTRPALAERDRHRAGEEALAAAAGSDRVHFLEGWTPYAQRGAVLLEADAVVSAHPPTEEARYAFRTRLLDALWARRPIVCTRGDVLADLVERAELGAVVAPGDAAAFAAGVRQVLDTPPEPARVAAAAAVFRWDRAVAPLADWIESGEQRSRGAARRRAVARHVRAQYTPLALETLSTDGPGAMARRVSRNVARMLRR